MTVARRWWCVALGVLLLVAAPILVRAAPARDEDLSAVALLDRIRASDEVGFSGYVDSLGTLALPGDDVLGGVADLVGERTRMHVWWRGPDDWRVSTLRTTGETALFHDGSGTTEWSYEAERATRMPDVPVRLPNTHDLLPTVLARWVLDDASPGELSRLPAVRVAGRDALGLRLTPAGEQSSVDHVDVFADRSTGLPLRVSVYGAGSSNPAVSTTFLDVSTERPDAGVTAFTAPPGAEVRFDASVDVAAAADRFAQFTPPSRLAGLDARSHNGLGSVGVYGRGPTLLVAIPLWERVACELRNQLRERPGVRTLDAGLMVATGPMRLMLAEPASDDHSWLVAGTVTRRALLQAADQLAADPPRPR